MRRSVIVGIVVFSCLMLLTKYISYQQYLIRKKAEQQYVLRELEVVKDRLVAAIGHSMSAVKTLAFIVSEYGIPIQFDSVAQTILQSSPYIDALQLTHQGVITHTYPMRGHEAAMGFDIFSDSARRQEAYRAIENKAPSFAGPFELKQGGTGIVGRLPIFKKNQFQGFAVVIIRLATLLKAVGIDLRSKGRLFISYQKRIPVPIRRNIFYLHLLTKTEACMLILMCPKVIGN